MITVLFFGKLAEIAGAKTELPHVASTDELLQQLRTSFPLLAAEKFIVAVDKKTITENTLLTDNCTVALLPPFSGG
ncbi:molybdopterin synthase catalytic subunit/molybdopterin synthase sulfur carrier subunit [Lacibacter cauensis]|uniref:Molybdopterin synthase catalytic subunit/molybdopterin synthase sulfur carrier subunit n=1 Tax=Lacibacter cauensis TaxID=510947 RepID=A0A562SW64_9BACT|nr:MoaD/ThiS family protein [Lacibacter cauensis]TWI85539.1 molybdopterin synthase catalytic subunit/molybdopterin synthase sulfur carrier subunit [Lacibacter cauensis]